MARHASARRLALAGVCTTILALPLLPSTARAATTATSTDTLTLTAGALSVAAGSAGSGIGALSASPASATLASATWGDTTGSGAGWNGTMAVSDFSYNGAWVTTSGGHSLATTGTQTPYNGSLSQTYYVVTVTSDNGSQVNASVTGAETATITNGAHNAWLAVGTHGLGIEFASGTTYSAGDQFTVHAGTLPASALQLGAGSSIAAQGTTQAAPPAFANSGATVTGGGVSTVGSGIKFVTAALNTGMGSFLVVPNGTVAFDPNNAWAGSYTAQVSYSIVTGP